MLRIIIFEFLYGKMVIFSVVFFHGSLKMSKNFCYVKYFSCFMNSGLGFKKIKASTGTKF